MRHPPKLRHGSLPSSRPLQTFVASQPVTERPRSPALRPAAIFIAGGLVLLLVCNLDTLWLAVRPVHPGPATPKAATETLTAAQGEPQTGVPGGASSQDTAVQPNQVNSQVAGSSTHEERASQIHGQGIPEEQNPNEDSTALSTTPPSPPSPSPPPPNPPPSPPIGTCPSYFHFVHDDLALWREKGGITWEAVNGTRRVAEANGHDIKSPSFFAVILSGKLYYEDLHECFQTRKEYTLYSILDLLERYPGQVTDVAFMFYCFDSPLIWTEKYRDTEHPPIVFQYNTNAEAYGINFPDWTYWGWEELKMPPWHVMQQRIREKAEQVPWERRIPKAQWKGSSYPLFLVRQPLVGCGYTGTPYAIDTMESRFGDDESRKVENQCKHKYKVYVEGIAWSVSMKYILACGSTPIFIEIVHWDFFSRALVKGRDYVHVTFRSQNKRPSPMCKSINASVTELESDQDRARRMANFSWNFIYKELTMEYVYDYMLYLFKEYSKLQTFEPSKLENLNVTEVTKEQLLDKLPHLKEQPRYPSWDSARRPCFEQ